MRIALLGCTGQIGRCLVRALAGQHDLRLYARDRRAMDGYLADMRLPARTFDLPDFAAGAFDLLINAIGAGAPGRIKAAGASILQTTEHFDRQCLDHLDRGSATAYIFLSTGSIYGKTYAAAQAVDPRPLPADRLDGQAYPLAKLAAEDRHRDRPGQPIADIRIFGYVSDQLDLNDDFLVAQMLRALCADLPFTTSARDFVRDYVGPDDLAGLIGRLIAADVPNGAYDLCSAAPTTKLAMLEALARDTGLRYRLEGVPEPCSRPPRSISRHRGAAALGHNPARTSLQNVLCSARALKQRSSIGGG